MVETGLQIIGAGYSKTGTKTMHEAYRILGYTVADAQENVYSHYDIWKRVWGGTREEGRKAMRELFGPKNKWGYNAAVDVPIFNMWEALADEFPEAKVILVVRDDASWEKAVLNHISIERKQFLEMWFQRCFGSIYRKVFNHSSRAFDIYMDFFRSMALGPEDPNFRKANMDVMLPRYRQHNQYVQNNCPKDRLLVYRIGEGWEPICKFLGKPIPKEPFPHMNRLGSVIKELSEHPDYIRTMKRQLIAWIIRLTLISGAIYTIRNREIFPVKLCLSSNRWPTIGVFVLFFTLFIKA